MLGGIVKAVFNRFSPSHRDYLANMILQKSHVSPERLSKEMELKIADQKEMTICKKEAH